jgi:hydroxypyruvate isomerase
MTTAAVFEPIRKDEDPAMNRREFLRATTASSFLALAPAGVVAGQAAAAAVARSPKRTFKLKYAPHLGMFEASAGKDPLDQIRFMADNGFTAFEDNGMMGRPVELQQQMGDLLAKLGMTMGVFVVQTGGNGNAMFTPGTAENPALFRKACEAAVDVAKRVGAKWMTVVPGNFERRLPIGIQTANVIDVLRNGAEVFEKHGLVMVLEPLSDTPDLFLRTSDQTFMICRAVDSPACKILFDIYHMQRNEGQIVQHIDHAWREIGYFQIGDNPGRKEPTTGEINYRHLFKHIHTRATAEKKEFVLGMEHGNMYPGAEGEQKLIAAYEYSDSF